jgi:HlyD family secretion protein
MTVMIRDTSGQDSLVPPTPRFKTYLRTASVSVLIIALIAYSVWQYSEISGNDRFLDRDDLRFAQVSRGSLVREVIAQGRVVAANSPTLFAQEPGIVHLAVKAGDTVTKGDLIAQIISPNLNEQWQQQLANLRRLNLQLDGVRMKNKRRKLELHQQEALAQVDLNAMDREKRRADAGKQLQVISRLDYEEAKDNLSRARLKYQQARQNNALEQESLIFDEGVLQLEIESQQLAVRALQRRVTELDILSPVDGMIGSIQIDDRQSVTLNQAMITVVDLDAFEIQARVSEGYADEMVVGMQARVQMGGATYTAQLAAISPEVTNSEVVARVRFVDSVPDNLRQNQRLSVSILLQNIENTLTVSKGAFFDNFRGDVFKINGDGINGDGGERVAVKLGSRSLREIEVLEGLNEGDTIIISALDYTSEDKSILIGH